MARVDYDRQSAVYDEGRHFDPDDYEEWRLALIRHLMPGSLVLDLGSGTGRWSNTLAQWFDIRIVGIEPSGGMRSKAVAKAPHERIVYAGGAAEALPVRDEVFDAAWLAHVIHHFDDLERSARELRRVVKPGGPVLIRQAFADRIDEISLFRFFPPLATETFPTVADTVDVFSTAGFEHVQLERHHQRTAPNLTAAVEKIRLRADTTLELLPDDVFEAGMRKLEEAARVEDGPVIDGLDLLVLR